MVDFLGGPICWGDLHRKDNWGDLKVWGDLILLGGPKTPLYTMQGGRPDHSLGCYVSSDV